MDLIGGIFPGTMRALNRVRDGLGLYSFSRSEFNNTTAELAAMPTAAINGDRRPAIASGTIAALW